MPSNAPSHIVEVYRTARSLPMDVWEALHANPRGSNVILPYVKKARQSTEVTPDASPNVWLVCSTYRAGSSTASVDFIVSCTEGPLGSYPLFIYTPIPATQLTSSFYTPRLRSLIRELSHSVPPERVFSVFALEPIARCFASLWTHASGIELEQDPEYYAAKLTYCNANTFQAGHLAPLRDVSYELRPARESDIKSVAELCYGFATTSVSQRQWCTIDGMLIVLVGTVHFVHERC